MPNLTNSLQYVALSTPSAIIAKMDLSDAGDSRTAFITSMIEEVSSTMTDYLGVHTLRAERTERYRLRKFSRTLSLDAFDVSNTITLKVAASPSDFATTTAETIDDDFVLDQRTGSITLTESQMYDPATRRSSTQAASLLTPRSWGRSTNGSRRRRICRSCTAYSARTRSVATSMSAAVAPTSRKTPTGSSPLYATHSGGTGASSSDAARAER